MSDIVADVGRLYQSFPYPNYPLLGKLRWQEGYATSSHFAGRLFESETGWAPAYRCPEQTKKGISILTVGCGEAQPYIMRQMEPGSARLVCVDLSERSLQRARIRLAFTPRPTSYHQAPIDDFLSGETSIFHHIDCYGVLHHLPNPTRTLAQLSRSLAPNGTMRIMVYNRDARQWIHHLQRAFSMLELSPYSPQDVDDVRALLRMLARQSPSLAEKISYLGAGTLKNTARLIDTFLHCREARLTFSQWWHALQSAGLVAYALFDRYAELDELQNPLQVMPSLSDLEERAFDGRFENNLEVFVRKVTPHPLQGMSPLALKPSPSEQRQLWMARLKSPPKRWFSYSETRGVPWHWQQKIWRLHLGYVYGERSAIDHLFDRLPVPALKRLARLGAIFPDQCLDVRLRHHLNSPLANAGEPRQWPAPEALRGSGMEQAVSQILARKNRLSERRRAQILARFYEAQL